MKDIQSKFKDTHFAVEIYKSIKKNHKTTSIMLCFFAY